MAAVLIVAGGTATYSELAPYFISGETIDQKSAALRFDHFAPGPSFESRSLVLSDCSAAIKSVSETDTTSQDLFQRCLSIARAITAESPVSAQAWLVQAQAADRLDDIPAFLTALQMTHITAPTEEWILLEAARLAEIRYDSLDADNRRFHQLDMGVLANTRNGLRWVADLYRALPDAQERVTAAINEQPIAIQRSFLRNIKAAAAAPVSGQ